MNRNFHVPIVLLFFFPGFCVGQGIGICHQVVSASGQHVEKQGIIWSYTVGEPIIATVSGGGLTLSQGFHQPDVCLPVSTNDLPGGLADWQIEIFPNPTAGILNIKFSPEKPGLLDGQVFDLTGKLLSERLEIQDSSGSAIDFSAFPQGVYFLRLSFGLNSGVFRFVKI